MLGGRKSAKDNGISIENRELIYARMCEFPEGSLFTQADIVQGQDWAEDFACLRDYDYVHVADGYFTRIVETDYLRRLPKVSDVISSYETLHGTHLIKTGDRTAWEIGLKQWEPVEGYRFYSSDRSDLLSLGRMKIRIIPAPSWLRSLQKDATLFRCFYDQPYKDIDHSLAQSFRNSSIGKSGVETAAHYGASILMEDVPEGWPSPHEVAAKMIDFVKKDES